MNTPLVTILGPTGSGKSDIAMKAAQATGAHIVAIDAFTIYRGMDIGTAKPTIQDQNLVPHHMIDLLEPQEEGTVVWFQRKVRAVIQSLQEQGIPTLLVGGSGLYFRAVLDPMEFPPTDAALRAKIKTEVAANPQMFYDKLVAIDPVAASKIEWNNVRRITRALEVIELSGRLFSSYATMWEDYQSIYPHVQIFGLEIDRAILRQRVQDRTHIMIKEGWIQECERLLENPISPTAAQAHGYKELFAYIQGKWTQEQATEQTIHRTRQYAARQQRWFRADPRVQWYEANDLTNQLIRALSNT